MREVLDIIEGGKYYGVRYLRTSDGDLFGVGDNDLDFCYMWRLRKYCRYWIKVLA